MALKCVVLLSVLAVEAVAQNFVVPTCCPFGQSLHLDDSRLRCYPDPPKHDFSYFEELLPPFASQHPKIVARGVPTEEFEKPPAPPYELAASTGTPDCGDPTKYELKYLLHGGNDIGQADYVVDDLNITKSASLAILDMKLFEVYENYCLAVGRSSDGTFRGTAVAFCAPTEEFDCSQRPCVSVCCPAGFYYDPSVGSCQRELRSTPPNVSFVDPVSLEPAIVPPGAVRLFFDRKPVGCTSLTVEENFLVLATTGDIFFTSSGATYRYTSYCVERVGVLPRDAIDANAIALRAFVCPQGQRILEETIIPILFIVSQVSLPSSIP